ncbi:MAG: hypothetical protein ACFFCE_13515 [Promethearchaeota archaeon]
MFFFKQVKGTLVLTIVKSIKINHRKRHEYDVMLSDKAKELLNQRILSASWYPCEEFRELFDALCYVEARNNPNTLLQWGFDEAKRWFTTIYQSTVFKGDLQIAFEKYSRFHRKVYNFGEVILNSFSDTELEITYKDTPHNWPNYYHSAVGWAMCFFQLCLDKKINYSYINKSWKGEGWTTIRFSWTQ